MDRIIKVTGKGRISVKPDMISLTIDMKGTYKDYETAVKRSAGDTQVLRETVQKAGLDPKELKTVRFSIDTEYENYRDKNNNYKRRFIGYTYHHNTHIDFPNDNKQLGRVLYELANSAVNVEFSIRYTVKDAEAVKNQLLGKAVADSAAKAEVLAKAAGVGLGDIVSIDYSWGTLEIYSAPLALRSYEDAECIPTGAYDIDIEADDIDVEDTVTIIWEIR